MSEAEDRADPDDAKPSQDGPEPVEKVEPAAVGMQGADDVIAVENQAQVPSSSASPQADKAAEVVVHEVSAPVMVYPTARTPARVPARLQMTRNHLVLLGDSTLDNERYLDVDMGDQPVGMQLARRCAELEWEFTLLATDGSTLDDVAIRQVPIIPDDATHLILSASGNDLLRLLNEVASADFSMASLFRALTEGLQEVSAKYRRIGSALASHDCHIACCTVYQPNFKNTFLTGLAACSLGLHNSRIRRIAEDLHFSVLDLAALCQDPDDFANPLELSTKGGRKVVQNLILFAKEHPTGAPRDVADRSWLAQVFGLNAECCAGCAPRRHYAQTLQEELIQEIPCQSPADFAQAQEQWRRA